MQSLRSLPHNPQRCLLSDAISGKVEIRGSEKMAILAGKLFLSLLDCRAHCLPPRCLELGPSGCPKLPSLLSLSAASATVCTYDVLLAHYPLFSTSERGGDSRGPFCTFCPEGNLCQLIVRSYRLGKQSLFISFVVAGGWA